LRKRIAVLVSGNGSNLERLVELTGNGSINGTVSLVIASNERAFAIERARDHGIDVHTLNSSEYSNSICYCDSILEKLDDYNIDLVILAGFLKILAGRVLDNFKDRIINLHPSLIPNFCGKGMYGERVHRAVLESGMKETGVTVHFVDEGTDTGPIILQKAVPVLVNDTVKTLAARISEVEHRLLPRAVRLFCQDRLRVEKRRVIIDGGGDEDGFTECLE
jgi:phosphoribosylglycinamide formyltransferase-1